MICFYFTLLNLAVFTAWFNAFQLILSWSKVAEDFYQFNLLPLFCFKYKNNPTIIYLIQTACMQLRSTTCNNFYYFVYSESKIKIRSLKTTHLLCAAMLETSIPFLNILKVNITSLLSQTDSRCQSEIARWNKIFKVKCGFLIFVISNILASKK